MRRLKRLEIDPEVLMLITSGTFSVIAHPMPKDARLVQTYVDYQMHTINIVVASETFEEVELGAIIPHMMKPTFSRGS